MVRMVAITASFQMSSQVGATAVRRMSAASANSSASRIQVANFSQIWLKFATWILLALEFALAADILRTAVAPTWEDIWKLAVIATIRTMLNYFLAKDIAAFEAQDPGQNPAPGQQTSP